MYYFLFLSLSHCKYVVSIIVCIIIFCRYYGKANRRWNSKGVWTQWFEDQNGCNSVGLWWVNITYFAFQSMTKYFNALKNSLIIYVLFTHIQVQSYPFWSICWWVAFIATGKTENPIVVVLMAKIKIWQGIHVFW